MNPDPATPRGGALERFRDGYGKLLEAVVILLVVALALEVTVGVVFRSLGRSLSWYDEVASVMLAWLTFYGSALASVRRAHISCPELVDKASPAVQRGLNILAQVLVIAFFAASKPTYEEFSTDVAGAKALLDQAAALRK